MENDGTKGVDWVAAELSTANAVAVVGAGASFSAGMPLAAQLPPLVWQALDTNPAVRLELANSLSVPDDAAQRLVGDDRERLRAAFGAICADRSSRLSFQRAFARLASSRSSRVSSAHDAMVRLIHRGVIEHTVYLNWDTLLEAAYVRRYGTGINSSTVRLSKPHGDARDPESDWVLPYQAGLIPQNLMDLLKSLVMERPRALLVIGYSGQDEHVVQSLIAPLADRWRVIAIGPNAIGPTAIRLPAEDALARLAEALCPDPEVAGWHYVTFANQRSIAAAIAGERLGPADVHSCPRLPQAEFARRQLELLHHVEITGPAGCGKSITAYQVAHDLLQNGSEVLRPDLGAPPTQRLLSSALDAPGKKVLIIDDGHLYPDQFIRQLAESASDHNAVIMAMTDRDAQKSGSITISNSAAVETLARAFRERLDEILPVVKALDDRVGERYMDTPIERRIDDACKAETPWQFNFILRGAWRYARKEMCLLKDLNRTDLLLVAVAAGQIMQLDAGVRHESLSHWIAPLGRDPSWMAEGLSILRRRQVILPGDLLRCPHIAFASTALASFFANRRDDEFDHVVGMLRSMLMAPQTPIRGISWLLDDLHHSEAFRLERGPTLLDLPSWDRLVSRCLNMVDALDRRDAAYALAALCDWREEGPKAIAGFSNVLSRWLEAVDDKSAGAFASFINALWNRNVAAASGILRAACPKPVAARLLVASPSAGYSWGYFLGQMHYVADEPWRECFRSSWDSDHLVKFTGSFDSSQVAHLSQFLHGVAHFDIESGFRCLLASLPILESALKEAPLDKWEEMQEITWFLLGHPPRFLRQNRPDPRQREYSRALARMLPIECIASDVSRSRQRDWERYSMMLGGWLREVDPARYRRLIRLVDLGQLDESSRGLWGKPSRELRLLIGTLACGKDNEPAKSWVNAHSAEIQEADPITAVVAPEVAISVVRRGGRVDLAGHNVHDWRLQAGALHGIAKLDQGLARGIVLDNCEHIINCIGDLQATDCDELLSFLELVGHIDRDLPRQLLERVDVSLAEKQWGARLREGRSSCKRTVSGLLRMASHCQGPICHLSRRIARRPSRGPE